MARLPWSFRLQAPFAKMMGHVALAILWISYAIWCFFMPFMLYTFLSNLLSPVFEKQLPAFVGKHDFENCINTKSCPEELPWPPVSTDYTYLGALYRTWNLQNRCESVYFLFMHPLWRLCLPFCVLPHVFCTTFSHFRNAFVITLLKNGPCSRKSHRTNM